MLEHRPEDIDALLAAIDAVMGARRVNGKIRDERAFTSPVGIVVATRGVDTDIRPPHERPRGGATRA